MRAPLLIVYSRSNSDIRLANLVAPDQERGWDCALSLTRNPQMASPKIKKKSSSPKTSGIPRQGVVPCLILLVIILVVIGFFFFAGFHVAG